jgi:hypothetical protein
MNNETKIITETWIEVDEAGNEISRRTGTSYIPPASAGVSIEAFIAWMDSLPKEVAE